MDLPGRTPSAPESDPEGTPPLGPVSAPSVCQDFETREIRSVISARVKEPSMSITRVCGFESHRRASEMQTLTSSSHWPAVGRGG